MLLAKVGNLRHEPIEHQGLVYVGGHDRGAQGAKPLHEVDVVVDGRFHVLQPSHHISIVVYKLTAVVCDDALVMGLGGVVAVDVVVHHNDIFALIVPHYCVGMSLLGVSLVVEEGYEIVVVGVRPEGDGVFVLPTIRNTELGVGGHGRYHLVDFVRFPFVRG